MTYSICRSGTLLVPVRSVWPSCHDVTLMVLRPVRQPGHNKKKEKGGATYATVTSLG